MTDKNLNKYANRLVNAFLKNKIISPLPKNIRKRFRMLKYSENYVRAKLKNLFQDLKQQAQEYLFLKN